MLVEIGQPLRYPPTLTPFVLASLDIIVYATLSSLGDGGGIAYATLPSLGDGGGIVYATLSSLGDGGGIVYATLPCLGDGEGIVYATLPCLGDGRGIFLQAEYIDTVQCNMTHITIQCCARQYSMTFFGK